MGIYLNPGNASFQSIRKGIYIDKSELISFVNARLGTKEKLICVSRPRRFGKSFAAQMLCAYYDKSCDSRSLFRDLKIASDTDFSVYLNQFNVLYLDMTWFLVNSGDIKDTVRNLQQEIIKELKMYYSEYIAADVTTLPMVLSKINQATGEKFIIIIDEWDALFREAKNDSELQTAYIDLLRGLFRSSLTDRMIEAAYMTGILPIKKYGTQSAMSDFYEYTMIQPEPLEKYVGFTEQEVRTLCTAASLDFDEVQNWYDGYILGENLHIYSPKSVLDAVRRRQLNNYWTQTETYESLKSYINSNFDHLKEDIIYMLAGNSCKITTRRFQNDMININSKDDVFTLLIHLGYLAYDIRSSEVFIPNLEIADEFKNAIEDSGWNIIASALAASESLLAATLAGDCDTVAQYIDKIHLENTSIISYNNENALSCVISIAYFFARKDYMLIRELPSGKGFADIVFLPRRNIDKPAMVIELKWDQSSQGAIRQILDKQYPESLHDYSGNILLVGISYNKKSKEHECMIMTDYVTHEQNS